MPQVLAKKHFLLLEVLIAFTLIAMCMIPLISPHTFILAQQKKFIQELEVNHLVTRAYADIVERLYRNEIPWNSIIQGNEFEIDDSLMQRVKFTKKLPFKGFYSFSEVIHKPTDDNPRKLYLLNLDFLFIPENKSSAGYETEIPGSLKFHYELFVIRDLGQGPPQAQEQKSGGQNPPPPNGGGAPAQ